MTIPLLIPRSPFKCALYGATLTLATTIGLLAPTQVRADVVVTVDKGQSTSQHKVTAPTPSNGGNGGGGNGGGGGGKGGSNTKTDAISGSVFYTLTVRNLAASAASGVTIEYHIYNRTTTSSSTGPSSVSLDDITDSVTLDLAGNAVKTIESKDVAKGSTHSTSGGSSGGGGGGKKGGGGKGNSGPPQTSSSNTSVMGWVVYVKKGDKVIHTITSTDTILDEVAKINKSGG
jgi:hypothetical protein